jgi:hypothetical protein
MMQMQQVRIEDLLDELQNSGINVAELKKLYERGRHTDALKESLIKLYQAHMYAAWLSK